MTSLQLDYSELRRRVGFYLGYGAAVSDWSSDSSKSQHVADSLAGGLRMFYWPDVAGTRYVWSFLQPVATLTTASGQSAYALPEDFSVLVSEGLTLEPIQSGRSKVQFVSEETVRTLTARGDANGVPTCCTTRIQHPHDGIRTRYELLLYPTPDASYTCSYRYAIEPTALDDANIYPLGGPSHAETVLEACLAAAEKTLNTETLDPASGMGVHAARFQKCLEASIERDKAASGAAAAMVWPSDNDATDLTATRAYLTRVVGLELGWGPHAGLWTTAQTKQAELIVQTGLRKFYHPAVLPGERNSHLWSFLMPTVSITTASGTYQYDLPADFGMLEGPMLHAPGTNTMYPPVRIMGDDQVRRLLQVSNTSGRPTMGAVRPKLNTEHIGGGPYELLLYPKPDGVYELTFKYHRNPGLIPADGVQPFGGGEHTQTVIEACLSAVEEWKLSQGIKTQLIHATRFMECLQASVSRDRRITCPDTMGRNFDGSDVSVTEAEMFFRYSQNSPVTYNGVSYT